METGKNNDDFPFALEAELGEIIDTEWLCPGTYYAAARWDGEQTAREYYVVEKGSDAISGEAKRYGKPSECCEGLLIYQFDDERGGCKVIEYEYQRYRVANHIPLGEMQDLHQTAVFAMELNPEYFGAYPAPLLTPRGYMLRYKELLPGVILVETDQCEKIVAIAYPIWSCDLSEYTLAHGEKLAYDIAHGMDQTLGYLFFPELSACLALYELKKRIIGADTKGLIDLPAMMNALWQRFPEYAISNNIREQLGLNDGFGLLMQSLGYEIELARNQEDLISIFPDHGQNYLIF